MRPSQLSLCQALAIAFPPRVVPCAMTLRQGDEIDTGYEIETQDDKAPLDWQAVKDEELKEYQWGMDYLDPDSWQFYLPAFMRYAICHPSENSLVIDRCISTLIPRDWKPDQFAQLRDEQLQIIVATLEFLSYDEESNADAAAYEVLFDHWSSKTEI